MLRAGIARTGSSWIPLQRWRLKWDILMMLMICFVMIVTPLRTGISSVLVGWSRRYTRPESSRRPVVWRDAFTPSMRVVSIRRGRGWFLVRSFEAVRTVSVRAGTRASFITNWTVNLLFIVDIVFNFLTAVYDPQLNKWLLRFDQIALHYARGWMALDIVSACCPSST